MSLTRKYIEDQYIENLINYENKRDDNSILYYYVVNPFCDWIVNFLPFWLAPNMITICGWFLNFLNLILTTYYTGWKGGGYIPPWVCFTCAFFNTAYILLYYLNGKQARRLNVSTPLDLLIAHGTESFNTFFLSIILGSFLYYSNIYQYLLFYFPIIRSFFLNTWEEYYKEELFPPNINDVAERLFIIDILIIISAVYGESFFNKKYLMFNKYKLKVSEIFGICVLIWGFYFSIKSIIGVLNSIRKEQIIFAIKDTLIYLLFGFTVLCIVFLTESIIVKEYPKILLFMFGFQFCKITGILQLSHILESPYKIYTTSFLIPFFALIIYSIVFYLTKFSLLISIDNLIIITFIWNVASWAHYVYYCSEEICEILNINIFKLGKRYSSRLSYEELKRIKF